MSQNRLLYQLEAHLAEYRRLWRFQVEYIKLEFELAAVGAVIFGAALGFLASSSKDLRASVVYIPFAFYAVALLETYLDHQIHVLARFMHLKLRPRVQQIAGTNDVWLWPEYHFQFGGRGRRIMRPWGLIVLLVHFVFAVVLLWAFYIGQYPLESTERVWLCLSIAVGFAVLVLVIAVHWLTRSRWGPMAPPEEVDEDCD